jgi:hypothetical protein
MEAILSMCCWPIRLDDDKESDETSPLLRTATLPAYTYESIETDEFRVVVLHPAQNFNDDIEFHLHTRKRYDDKFYEAVSYTGEKMRAPAISLYTTRNFQPFICMVKISSLVCPDTITCAIMQMPP